MIATRLRRYYHCDPWDLSWGEWRDMLANLGIMLAMEAGSFDHRAKVEHQAQQIRRAEWLRKSQT